MKTPSEKLFSVISSMDKHEKRYFKTHSYKNSDLLNLFDAINKQKIYNENKLKKVFRNNPVFVNFKVLKSNLLKVLIKSLSDYHSSISVDSKLLNLLQQAEVFEKKNLIEIAEDFLGKAEKIAADNDRHNYLLMIVYFKTKLSRATSLMPKLEYYLNTESVKEDTYLKTVKTNIAYQRLFIKSHIIYNLSSLKSKENLQAAKSLIKSPLLRENNKPSDFYSLNQYYQLHFFYSMYTNKWSSRVYIQQKEWISYLEEDKEKLPIRALTYIGSLVNLMVVQYKLNKNEEFENSFGKSKLFFESLSPKIRSEAIVSNFAVLTTNYMHCQNMRLNPDRAIEAWEYLKKIINSNTYSTSGLLTLYDNLSDSYLLKGLYRKALRSINKILMIKTSNRLDIQKNSRMLQLLVHYQLGHYDILPALSKHTLHWITQNATVTPFDTIVLNTFKDSLNKKVSKAEEVKILRRIKNEIALLKTDFIKEESTYITWHIAWIDSKILMKPLIEILKQTPYKTMLR